MKARRWFVHFPGDANALGPVHFVEPVNEAAVREWARNAQTVWTGRPTKRLPVGFECWPA